MRVSSLSSFLQGVKLMQRIQSTVYETQEQISTGSRILRPSEDPIGASNSVTFREALSRLDQYDRNANAARTRLEYEENALGSINRALNRWRELALRANNATEPVESRQQVAIEMDQLLKDLVQVANQTDGNGRYLFAGTRDGTAPVTATTGGFVYNGDQNQRLIQIGDSREVFDGDSGADVFFNIRNGNGEFRVLPNTGNTGTGIVRTTTLVDPTAYDLDTYTLRFLDPVNYEVRDSANAVVTTGSYVDGQSIEFAGTSINIGGEPAAGDEFVSEPSRYQSMFQSIQNIIDTLRQGTSTQATRAQLNSAVNNGIQEIDLALENVSEIRTRVGIRLNAIDGQLDSNSGASLLAEQAISELEDLDYAEALSRLTQQAATLEATQASFARTQSLSLFRFL